MQHARARMCNESTCGHYSHVQRKHMWCMPYVCAVIAHTCIHPQLHIHAYTRLNFTCALIAHANKACNTHEWDISHVCPRMRHLSCVSTNETSRIRHATRTNETSLMCIHEWDISNKACNTHEWDISHVYLVCSVSKWNVYLRCSVSKVYRVNPRGHLISRHYGVALVSRIDQIIGLFCKRGLEKRRYSAKETYNFIDPTDRSHPIDTQGMQHARRTRLTHMAESCYTRE